MRSQDKKIFYFHADAHTLGGFIEAPFPRSIPAQASVSLSSVGGEASVRTGAFNFEEIVSCEAAYTRVTGRRLAVDGPWSMTATAVVEGLRILDTFTADRMVAQVSLEYSQKDDALKVSLAGSTFTGLRVGGCDATPKLSATLLCGAKTALTRSDFQRESLKLAGRIKSTIDGDKELKWLEERFFSKQNGSCVLSSMVESIPGVIPGATFGHVIDLPEFGRIFLGEVLACPSSIQVFSFRAELGCGTKGSLGGPTAQVHGVPWPP